MELNEIRNEAIRLQEDTLHTEVQHHIAARYWQRCHYLLGLIATVAGVFATSAAIDAGTSVPDGLRWIAPTTVTVLAAVIAFLRPDGKADAHHDKGVRYNDLRRRIRMFIRIDLPANSGEEGRGFLAKLEAFGSEKTSLNREKPTAPSGMIYWLAKREIKAGHAEHEVDKPSV